MSFPTRFLRVATALCAWRIGPPLSYFEEPGGIAQAVAGIATKIGEPVRVLSILVSRGMVVVRAQESNQRSRVNEWRVVRKHLQSFNWEAETGPTPYQPPLINPDLEANLFVLSEVDLGSADRLIREAVEKAHLEDAASVADIEIARTVSILPEPASGPVGWAITVTSGWETARVTADGKGQITGVDVADTLRAKTLDLFKQPEKVVDAARAIRIAIGGEPALVKVTIGAKSVAFETNLPDKSFPIPVSGSLKSRATYTWTLNGLSRALGSIDTSAAFGNADAPFSVDDVDWGQLPKLLVSAREALGLPDAKVADIEVSKPTIGVGEPKMVWKVEVEDANRERGTVFADVSGAVVRTQLPPSRRAPVNRLDPEAVAAVLAEVGREFGPAAKIAEIIVTKDSARITAYDPRKPDELAQFVLGDKGIERFGTASPFAAGAPPFTVADLATLTAERVRDLEAKTAETLKLAPEMITSITLSRASLDPSPAGNVTVEIRAEEAPFGKGGRVNYEIDGTVIKAYLP